MKKERVRINLDLTPEMANKVKQVAETKDIAVNALIRLALEAYLKENYKEA